MSDLSDKSVCVVCSPLFVSIAERLARDFGRVYLHVPFAGAFPTMNTVLPGYGIEGVELVTEIFGPHFDKVDLWVFPDLHRSQTQIHLEGLGKRVWGNRNAEELENYRELCKEEMEKMGLPVQPWVMVKGVDALRAHLKSHDKQHVKINLYRGVTETFFAPTYEIVEGKIDALAASLGGFKDVLDFICEDDLPDKLEVGVDTYCIDGDYPKNTLFGLEIKDCGYLGQMVQWSDIPEPLRRWNEAFAPLFERYGMRGSVSNEIRIGKDHVPYMVDATIRAPCPPSELWQELFTNLAEIMWQGADGILVEPIPAGKWGVEVVIKSAWAEKNWQEVSYPDKYSNQIKLFNKVVINGRKYVVPQEDEMSEIGAVVGWGDSIDEAMAHAKEAGDSIEGYGVKFSMGAADQARKQIEELSDIGVSPFVIEKGGVGSKPPPSSR